MEDTRRPSDAIPWTVADRRALTDLGSRVEVLASRLQDFVSATQFRIGQLEQRHDENSEAIRMMQINAARADGVADGERSAETDRDRRLVVKVAVYTWVPTALIAAAAVATYFSTGHHP